MHSRGSACVSVGKSHETRTSHPDTKQERRGTYLRFSVHARSTQPTQVGAWRTGPRTNANANNSALSQTMTHAQYWTPCLGLSKGHQPDQR
ncbi:unnamed protein product [Fusarium venenatum]|uniref:Uncharacterized protein n=1 Tax=Fusarium venenatum TaxID=56646 RepID=A0A2L2TP11_9HYPO|nr:LOW QUALITY PROTEIN: uncharacterized protein FVRRES_03069 [Fusarium venenatum]CEI66557.1 unnamed protein product [Fusarium venenatum]